MKKFVFIITLNIHGICLFITLDTFYFNSVLISMLILFKNPRLMVKVWGK